MIDVDYLSKSDEFLVTTANNDRDLFNLLNDFPFQSRVRSSVDPVPMSDAKLCSVILRNNYQTCWDLSMMSDEMEWVDEALEARRKTGAVRKAVHKVSKRRPEYYDDKPESFFTYQWRMRDMLQHVDGLWIQDDTGLGKTRSALAGVRGMKPVMIVCPSIAVSVWENEIRATFPEASVTVLNGDISAERRRTAIMLMEITPPDFCIMSYGTLIRHSGCRAWPSSKKLENTALNDIRWGAVIVDESHRIKNPSAIQTRCCWRLAEMADKRIAITATPLTRTPEDLWAQCRFLYPDEFRSFSAFREQYLLTSPGLYGGLDCHGWAYQGEEQFQQVMGWRTGRRHYGDEDVARELEHFEIPEEGVRTVVEIDMLKQQRDEYKRMCDYLMANADGGQTFIAQSGIEKWVRLRQLANGNLIVSPMNEVLGLKAPSNKAQWIAEKLMDVECNVVIYAEHSKVVFMLYEYLAGLPKLSHIQFNCITGGVIGTYRDKLINDFQNEPMQQVLLCTTGAVSESVTLTNAGLLIFAQEPTSLHQMVQCRGRVRRIGSKAPVPIITLRSKQTVEVSLANGMFEKERWLTDHLRNMADPEKYVRKILQGEIDASSDYTE